MSGELPFLDIDGVEVANGYRTLSYLQRNLGTLKWEVGGLGCDVLAREVGGVGPFVSPTADPAPWYDAAVPESAEFLGLMIKLDFQSLLVTRAVDQRVGSRGGSIGPEVLAAKAVVVEGYLVASTCPGLEYGRRWIAAKLGAYDDDCDLYTLRVRDSCPLSNGSDDTRGEWLIYDAALADGITRSDIDPGCCDYDGQNFTLYGQSPYLYKRPGTATSAVEIANIAGFLVAVPSSQVNITSPIVTIVGSAATSTTRVQMGRYPLASSEIDAFTTNSIPTRWYQTSALYSITGGKLKPAATGARLIKRSRDGTVGNVVKYAGGRVEATIKIGTTITNGVWVVGLDPSIYVGLRKATNLFVMSATSTAGTTYDSEAFTPVAGHTYRLILEAVPTATGWDARAWIVDQAAPTVMLTPPLVASITGSGLLTPAIYSTCVDTAEEWDSFFARELASAGDANYVDVVIPPGTMVLDASRKVAVFTPSGSTTSMDGSRYLESPDGTPLYWPALRTNDAGYVAVTGTAGATPGATASVALQARRR